MRLVYPTRVGDGLPHDDQDPRCAHHTASGMETACVDGALEQ